MFSLAPGCKRPPGDVTAWFMTSSARLNWTENQRQKKNILSREHLVLAYGIILTTHFSLNWKYSGLQINPTTNSFDYFAGFLRSVIWIVMQHVSVEERCVTHQVTAPKETAVSPSSNSFLCHLIKPS